MSLANLRLWNCLIGVGLGLSGALQEGLDFYLAATSLMKGMARNMGFSKSSTCVAPAAYFYLLYKVLLDVDLLGLQG